VCGGCQDDDDRLGFACLPEQVHRKAVKRGFDFTVMVVGSCRLTSILAQTRISHRLICHGDDEC